jgi:peroxiredoxin
LAISGDDLKTMAAFKKSLNAAYPFISDPDAVLMKLFDVKYPFFAVPSRHTFVVGKGRRIEAIFSGGDAIDANQAIESCSIPTKN